MAVSFYPPPIANSWKDSLPTTYSANSYNSLLGSEPGEIINKMGSKGVDSCSNMFLNANGAGYTYWPPKASRTNYCIADSSLSGLNVLTNIHL